MGMLDGKVAIVTGAGNGVGRGEAVMLADHGAKVVVNDLGGSVTGEGSDKRAADEVVDVIKKRGGEAVANYDSVADFEGAKNIIGTAIDAFGRLDVLVNNAGILRDKMMFSMTPEDFDAVVKVHMYGAFNTMHHASVYWRNESKEGRQPRASIVNTVSSAGLQGQASQINYGAAKAGIAAMTIIASLELERYGVRANCIGPGGATRMVAQAMKIEVKNPEDYTEFESDEPGQLGARRRVARVRRVAARHRSGAPPRRQQPRALPGRGRWASSSSPPTRTATPKQWDPADIGRIAQPLRLRQREPRHRRPAPRLTTAWPTKRRDRRRGALRLGRVDTKTPFELHYQAASRALADAGLTKDDIDGLGSSGMGLLAPIEIGEYLGLRPTWVDGTGVGGSHVGVHGRARDRGDLAGHVEVVVLVYGSTTRADLKARRRSANLVVRRPRPGAVRHAVRAHADREVRDGGAPHMHEFGTTIEQLAEIAVSTPLQRVAQPRGLLPRPDHDRRRAELADDRRPAHQAALLHPQRRRRRGRAHVRGAGPRPAPSSRSGCSAPARRRRTRR